MSIVPCSVQILAQFMQDANIGDFEFSVNGEQFGEVKNRCKAEQSLLQYDKALNNRRTASLHRINAQGG